MTINDAFIAEFESSSGEQLSRNEIINRVHERVPHRSRSSIIPSDYCYNIVNAGYAWRALLFENVGKGEYEVLGLGSAYSGELKWKGDLIGSWENGKLKLHRKVNNAGVQKNIDRANFDNGILTR